MKQSTLKARLQARKAAEAEIAMWLERGGRFAFKTIYDAADPPIRRWLLETFRDFVWVQGVEE
jgi:hypothetical protein